MLDRNRHFRFDPKEVEAVILSHAHIDHSGNLPNLVKQGFEGNIYATDATRDLCHLMLADSAYVQAADVRFMNAKRAKAGQPPVEPIYTPQEAEVCMRQFVSIGYQRPIQVANGVRLTFIDAGHILGSAQVILDLHEHSSNRRMRLLFSGDIGRGASDILKYPEYANDVDAFIMESTYGGIEHSERIDAEAALADVINRAVHTRGKILIPSFAVERTQMLIYSLHKLLDQKKIPDLPIYVDSPLAVSATEVFRMHPECFNEEVYNFLFERRNPFGFDGLTMIRELQQSKMLNSIEGPAVIISASGMCEAGRIRHHLANNIANPTTTVLFVGHCAEQTLGWKIRRGDKAVNIFGEPYEVKAHIEAMDHFSGHADHSELVEYFKKTQGSKRKVWLVHGEPDRSKALLAALKPIANSSEFEIAEDGKTVVF